MNKKKEFQILAISGGGYRGLYSALILEELERKAGKPLAKCFDLICGTSIGGIIATALGMEIPMNTIVKMLTSKGPKIFQRRFLWLPKPISSNLSMMFRSKYSQKELKKELRTIFQNSRMGDIAIKGHRVLIPSVNFTQSKPQLFKTPHHKIFANDLKLSLVDIALATSAAPPFFPMHHIDKLGYFIDGGIVGNSPEFFGLHEATHYLNIDEDSIRILGIGTLDQMVVPKANQKPDIGWLGWGLGKKLFNLTLASQQKATRFIVQHKLDKRYILIDKTIPSEKGNFLELDAANKISTRMLKEEAGASIQEELSKSEVLFFLNHQPTRPDFFHLDEM